MSNNTPIDQSIFPTDGLIFMLERTLQKFIRDFIANLLISAPLMVMDGSFEPKLFLPTLGMVLWRTVRDVIPAAMKREL